MYGARLAAAARGAAQCRHRNAAPTRPSVRPQRLLERVRVGLELLEPGLERALLLG